MKTTTFPTMLLKLAASLLPLFAALTNVQAQVQGCATGDIGIAFEAFSDFSDHFIVTASCTPIKTIDGVRNGICGVTWANGTVVTCDSTGSPTHVVTPDGQSWNNCTLPAGATGGFCGPFFGAINVSVCCSKA